MDPLSLRNNFSSWSFASFACVDGVVLATCSLFAYDSISEAFIRHFIGRLSLAA